MAWSEQRLRELAEAEEEALAGSDGLLACSPELYQGLSSWSSSVDITGKLTFETNLRKIMVLRGKLKQGF